MTADSPIRVLLTLDCGAVDADSLRAAKLIAADGQLEITGLYVEDEDLYRAAQLPGAVDVQQPDGTHHGRSIGQGKALFGGQSQRL